MICHQNLIKEKLDQDVIDAQNQCIYSIHREIQSQRDSIFNFRLMAYSLLFGFILTQIADGCRQREFNERLQKLEEKQKDSEEVRISPGNSG